VISLSKQSLPDEIRQGLLRKVFGLLGAQLLAVFSLMLFVDHLREQQSVDLTGYPLCVLVLSFVPHATIWLLSSAKISSKPLVYLRQSHPLNLVVLAAHTLVQACVWVFLDSGVGTKFLLEACLLLGVTFSTASFLAGCEGDGALHQLVAPLAASPGRLLVAGWCVGVVVALFAGPALGTAPWTWEITALAAALFLLDVEWSNRQAFAKGCPDSCFALVAGMCRGMVILTHASVSIAVLIHFSLACCAGLTA